MGFVKRVIGFIRRHLRRPVKILPVYVPVLKNDLLKGRRALITGGSSGIGLAMAKAFLDAGAEVIITGRRKEALDDAVKKLPSDRLHALELDNREVERFADKLRECCDRFGVPDVLVNNAGTIVCKTFGDTELENYNQILDTNLRGSYFLSQEMAKIWKSQKVCANILNVGSSSSLRPGNSPYVLSKWGVRAMTLGLAKELIGDGIVVNGIAPGPTATKLFVKDGEGIERPASPARRLCTEEEVAGLAVIMVSDMARMVVGDMLYVTGGSGVITVDDVG